MSIAEHPFKHISYSNVYIVKQYQGTQSTFKINKRINWIISHGNRHATFFKIKQPGIIWMPEKHLFIKYASTSYSLSNCGMSLSSVLTMFRTIWQFKQSLGGNSSSFLTNDKSFLCSEIAKTKYCSLTRNIININWEMTSHHLLQQGLFYQMSNKN